MSHACTPILVGVAFLVSEILLLSKMSKFPFLTMDYSPWQAWVKYMTIVSTSSVQIFDCIYLVSRSQTTPSVPPGGSGRLGIHRSF